MDQWTTIYLIVAGIAIIAATVMIVRRIRNDWREGTRIQEQTQWRMRQLERRYGRPKDPK